MIKSYYVICNGQPLYSTSKNTVEEAQALLSGFLSAFQSFASSLDKSKINKIELDKSTFFYSSNQHILSVVEADTSDEIENKIYQIAAERLGRAFLNKFSDDKLSKWCGDLNDFSDFKEIYDNIISDLEKIMEKSQKEFITEYFVGAANDENILGAVVFDLEKDEIIASDIPTEFSVQDFESFGSMLFSFIGRLAKELKAGEINELILRAKNYWIGGFKKNKMAVFMIFKQEYFGTIIPNFVKDFIEK